MQLYGSGCLPGQAKVSSFFRAAGRRQINKSGEKGREVSGNGLEKRIKWAGGGSASSGERVEERGPGGG